MSKLLNDNGVTDALKIAQALGSNRSHLDAINMAMKSVRIPSNKQFEAIHASQELAKYRGGLGKAIEAAKESERIIKLTGGFSKAMEAVNVSEKFRKSFGSFQSLRALTEFNHFKPHSIILDAILERPSVITNFLHGKNTLYEQQLSFIECLTKDYFKTTNDELPSWINYFNNIPDDLNIKPIPEFDILSDDDKEREFEKARSLMNDSELKTLFSSFDKNITNKLKKKKRVKAKHLKEPNRAFAEFIHKHINNEKFSLQTIYLFVLFLRFVLEIIIIGSVIEAKGAELFQFIFGNSAIKETVRINESSDNNIDFAIEDAYIYLRKSPKTKQLGKIVKGTTLIILGQKPGWCFVEAYVIRAKSQEQQIIRGWIIKKHLDNFQ